MTDTPQPTAHEPPIRSDADIVMGFVLYSGTYTYQFTRFQWEVGCDEFVFDFRSKRHEPTLQELAEAPKRGYRWYKIVHDHDQTEFVWVCTFDGADPVISGMRVSTDKSSLN